MKDMKFIKDDRELRSIDEFGVSEKAFIGLRLAEQPHYEGLKEKVTMMAKKIDA